MYKKPLTLAAALELLRYTIAYRPQVKITAAVCLSVCWALCLAPLIESKPFAASVSNSTTT